MDTINMLVGIGMFLCGLMTIAVMIMLFFLKGHRQDQRDAEKIRSQMWNKISGLESDVSVMANNIEHLSTDIAEISEYVRQYPRKGDK